MSKEANVENKKVQNASDDRDIIFIRAIGYIFLVAVTLLQYFLKF